MRSATRCRAYQLTRASGSTQDRRVPICITSVRVWPIVTGFMVDATGSVVIALAIGAGNTILNAVLLQTLLRSQVTSADLAGDTAIAVPAQ